MSKPRLVVWAIVLALTAVCRNLPATPSSPSVPEADRLPHADDVWVVSTRSLPDIDCIPAHVTFDVERLATGPQCRRWERADLASLLDEPDRPLLIFVHGNRYDPAAAKEQGVALARRSAASCPEAEPARTVVFSWPSAKQGLLLRDSRAKYERARSEGNYLAWFLGQVEPERPVAIVAYSSGCLIALEAIDHLAGDGRTDCRGLGLWNDRLARRHLVLVAAAVRSDALAPCGEYHRVLGCIDRLTLLNNSRDKALKFFRFIDPILRPEALGHEQMPARWIPPEVEFAQADAAAILGKSHRFLDYLETPSLARRLAAGTLDGLRVP